MAPNQSTLTGPVTAAAADVLSNSSQQLHTLGAYCETADGRGFRYAKIGATSSVPGQIYASPAYDATNQTPVGGLAVGAAAIGDTSVTLTGTLTLAANLLAGGFLMTDVTPGQGYTYKILGNTAVSAAANCVVTLADPIQVALTASSKVVVTRHPYDSVIVNPTTKTGTPVGVPPVIQTNGNFGWLQTYGACAILSGVATSISTPGVPVTTSQATAGAVIVSTAVLPTVGWSMQLFTATEYQAVHMTIR